jgi:prevent-host-death family protein
MEVIGRAVGAYEAKTKLPQLLEDVAKGEVITITKHGVPVAKLVPVEAVNRQKIKEEIDAFRKWRKEQNLSLGGISIRELIEEGRR